jgi:AcrR family transcriptional regulator
VPYACGLKSLDNIYLDTTFAVKSNIYRHFASKAEGIKELLEKVGRYPKDTIFYLRAWTFGYEEVWQALSAFLDSKVRKNLSGLLFTDELIIIGTCRPIPIQSIQIPRIS